jgi:elongation factor 3
MKAVNLRIAQRAGLYIRPLSTKNVEQHLEDCGLSAEFGTHYRMAALSGGQKVKVVLAAAMWNQPHILILDEVSDRLEHSMK